MIDHVTIVVSDYPRSRAFYLAALAPLGFAVALAGEIIGRYLFFVSVVPRNMAMTFFSQEREAA